MSRWCHGCVKQVEVDVIDNSTKEYTNREERCGECGRTLIIDTTHDTPVAERGADDA